LIYWDILHSSTINITFTTKKNYTYTHPIDPLVQLVHDSHSPSRNPCQTRSYKNRNYLCKRWVYIFRESL